MSEEHYWTQCYQDGSTGWDIGYPSIPLKTYIDQVEDKNLRILIPGAGNAYEAAYLYEQGFKQVFVMDISKTPLESFQKRYPNFPKNQLLQEDFFTHEGTYDLIFEQTFFCSFLPTDRNRQNYVHKMSELLKSGGKLVGLWFDIPLLEGQQKRPFGGNKKLYLSYLKPHFEVKYFDLAENSIAERKGQELFGVFKKASEENFLR